MRRYDKIIDVTYTTDSAGLIKPLYFYLDYKDSFETHFIERIIRRDPEKINGDIVITFTCEIVIENMRRLCDLRFNEAKNTWILYRM